VQELAKARAIKILTGTIALSLPLVYGLAPHILKHVHHPSSSSHSGVVLGDGKPFESRVRAMLASPMLKLGTRLEHFFGRGIFDDKEILATWQERACSSLAVIRRP